MPTGIRFHLDECMPSAVADGLNKRGRDCTVSRDAGLIGATDEQQLAFAVSESRVLVTCDDDFLSIAASTEEHSGVVYWTKTTHFGQLIRDLDALAANRSAEAVKGATLFL